MAKIKKTDFTKCWRERGGTGTLMNCWWECKMYNHFREQFGSFLKYPPVILSSHPIPRYLPQRKEEISPYKELPINIHSCFICHSPKLEIIQIPSAGG